MCDLLLPQRAGNTCGNFVCVPVCVNERRHESRFFFLFVLFF